MQVITITKENFNQVYGRLNKFLTGHREYNMWHNFNCGMKKRISKYISIDGKQYTTIRKVYDAKLKKHDTSFIVVMIWSPDSDSIDGFMIKPGDRIAFIGNRIVVRTKYSCLESNDYIYWSIQIA